MRIDPRQILRRHGFRPKKSWSQNFLVDPEVIAAIVDAADASPEQTVIELGAGLGVLTHGLRNRAKKVLAVERDRDMAAVLRAEFADDPNVEVVEANAATLKWNELCEPIEGRPVVVGNLPYHMATPILFHLLSEAGRFSHWVLMLQKEMADRLIAGPGSRTYGVTSILVQQQTDIESVVEVSPEAFVPAPKVRSSVLRFFPRKEPRVRVVDQSLFARVVRAAFGQRRKILRNSLMAGLAQTLSTELVDRAISMADLDGNLRPEQLSIEQFARIADMISQIEKEKQEGPVGMDQ